MNNGCCSKCQAKSKKIKKLKKLKEEFDEEDVKQKQKVSDNENLKTDSNMKQESHRTLDKKEKSILTWRHTSLKKEKAHSKNFLSDKTGVNQPSYTAESMMYHGGPNPSNWWPTSTAPRGPYSTFSMAPMYGPYGYGGGPMFNGVQISPYQPMAAAFPPPYWQARPFTDTNPMTRYTSYADNYSYCFI